MSDRPSYILGTAGHVDHGKTTLIKALTGIETDRLPEEKARGLSIDLGFAHLALPSGGVLGIVDVPGHERFLKNMMAGVGGFDMALLVIDAAECVMPQTREHMEILQQLGISAGLVALTKSDLVDADFLELATDEVREFLVGTFLEGAPIVPVSAVTGAGLPVLIGTIDSIVARIPHRPLDAPPYLPVDRVFVKTGFGTVVTGSMWSGTLRKGDRVAIMPEGEEVKVRGLQVHGSASDTAHAGQRVAVNLGGIEAGQVRRGQVLSPPGTLQPSNRLDANVRVLPRAPRPLKNRSRIRLYFGTEEALGKVVVLDGDVIAPGAEGLVQFILESPVVARRGDRFVLRNSTAEYTVGGGAFLEVAAEAHHRKDAHTLEILRHKEEGQADGLLNAFLLQESSRPRTVAEVADTLKMDRAAAEDYLHDLEIEAWFFLADGKQVMLAQAWGVLEQKARGLLQSMEEKAPWKTGWKLDETSKLLWDDAARKRPDFTRMAQELILGLVERGVLKYERGLLSTPDHVAHLDAAQEKWRTRIMDEVRKNEFAPPSWEDVRVGHGVDARVWKVLSDYMLESGDVVFISKDIFFLGSTVDEARRRVVDFIRKNQSISPAQARDILGTSRKYIIPLLEYFDNQHVTRRDGDTRVLGSGR